MTSKDELTLALELSDIADEIAMSYFQKGPEVSTKKDGTIVTEADREIERTLRTRIAEVFPQHSILGEEEGMIGDEDAPTWIIDPIDGTNNFAAGIGVFGTLIALRVESRVVVGVASGPALGERYHAARGGGAHLNGQPIKVSGATSLSDATVCFGSFKRMVRHGYGESIEELLRLCKRDRGFGDFWGHMLVARGAIEAMAEPSLSVWDVAALEVIVAEAGGRLTSFAGMPYASDGVDRSVLTTNTRLHEQVTRILTSGFSHTA